MAYGNRIRRSRWAIAVLVGTVAAGGGLEPERREASIRADEPSPSAVASPRDESAREMPQPEPTRPSEDTSGSEEPVTPSTGTTRFQPVHTTFEFQDGTTITGNAIWRRGPFVLFKADDGPTTHFGCDWKSESNQKLAASLPSDMTWVDAPAAENRAVFFDSLILPTVGYSQSDVARYPWPAAATQIKLPKPLTIAVSGNGERALVKFPGGLTEVWTIDGTTRLATITPATPPEGTTRFPDASLKTALSYDGRYAYLIRTDLKQIIAYDVEGHFEPQIQAGFELEYPHLSFALTSWMQTGEFETLDALYDWLVEHPDRVELRMGVDWSHRLTPLMIVLVENGDGKPATNGWTSVYQDWITARPETILGRIVSARNDLAIGGRARGNGYAHTVTDEGWRIFREKYRTAYLTLEPVLDHPHPPSTAFTMMLAIAKGMSFPEDERVDLIRDLMDHHPTSLLSHFEAADSFLTRWGGEDGRAGKYIDQVTRRVTERQGETQGNKIYASLCARYRLFPEREVWGASPPDKVRVVETVIAKMSTGNCPTYWREAATAFTADLDRPELTDRLTKALKIRKVDPLDATDRPLLAAAKAWPQRYVNAAVGREVDFSVPPPRSKRPLRPSSTDSQPTTAQKPRDPAANPPESSAVRPAKSTDSASITDE